MDDVNPPRQGSNSSGGRVPDRMEMIRVYQAWKGSNRFLMGGRFVFGPDARSIFMTISLIVIPIAVFCVFVAKNLMDDFPHHLGILIMVVPIVFTFWDLLLLLLTSARDPGIVPRNLCPPEPEVIEGITEAVTGQPLPLRLPRVKEVQVNGITVKVKYCDTCMLYRPPRCSHCSICNNCVERFDHHCPWVGQCIGQRNYRFYFLFVLSTTLLCLYIFAFCWVYIRRIMDSKDISIWKAMAKTPASIVLIAYTFLSFWFVGGLTMFHLYLISTNQSTYENFRYRYDRRENPYNKGIINNFKEVFCTSIPESKNKFRRKVMREPEIRTGSMSGSFSGSYVRKAFGGDLEMGSKPVWDDATSNDDDLERHAIQNDSACKKDGKFDNESCSDDPSRDHLKQNLAQPINDVWGISGSWVTPPSEDLNRSRNFGLASEPRMDRNS
ncbi:probable protein S-acyltransferase 7 [Impatiens glandulifera]|uniref:probable protein S-acyltransferase 7 n=1 Tax=Impatiens glandulifera TaxID=253017 RepID=UPI001FB10776|nr:probable protein S-acyltransferase 7 [Impatiens glandulifera]